jgi:hypothetical protein
MKLLLSLALLLAPVSIEARPPREMVEIKAGDPTTIRADRAYILFRTVRPEGVHAFEPVFLRIPTQEEMERYNTAKRQAYERAEPDLIRRRERQVQRNAERLALGQSAEPVDPVPSLEKFNFVYDDIYNVQNIQADRALVQARPESTYLVEVMPGSYVLYGASWRWGPANLYVCFCLGSVGFSAPAGTVTDLGYFLADTVHHVSKIPELRPESGFGLTMSDPAILIGATIRPVRSDSPVPEALHGANVHPAEYRAIGRFFEPRAAAINRLVPVPGILDYDEGRVIDVRTGTVVPDVN